MAAGAEPECWPQVTEWVYRSCEALALAWAILSGVSHAQSMESAAVDTEHIFGFTEGADIGEKGEKEVESSTTTLLGRPGSFAALENETAFRYGVAEHFRASVGVLADYDNVQGVPNLLDRTGFAFGGASSEFRWQVSEREKSPLDLTLSFAPEWQRVDPTSGRPVGSYTLPVAVLADTALVPNKTFAAFNMIYSPTLTQGQSEVEQPLELSAAIATAIADGIFVGAEIRHITLNQEGFFTGHALFAGPSVFVQLAEDLTFTVAWSAQIPDETTGRLDTVNFERHQVLVNVVKGF